MITSTAAYRPPADSPAHEEHELVALVERIREEQARRSPAQAAAITRAAIARWSRPARQPAVYRPRRRGAA